ncbi:MAG: response regulator [Clostridiales bacterium]|nr:response regulator [Clostridiales bacterium]
MIRIAAVDDELHALKRFERMIQNNSDIELCGLFETGKQLLDYIKNHSLNAVFLDIEMPDMNGLVLSQQILNIDEHIEIIFMTAFNQYAVEAFELQAIDYIMKPIKKERLEKTVKRLLKIKATTPQSGNLFLQCFGDFEVFINGEATVWKNSKAKEILAFLVYKNGVAVNWEKIVDAVWPDFDAEKAQANFHANSYLLRKVLSKEGIPEILEGSRGNYRIVKDGISCDLYQLEAMIKANQFNRKEDLHLLEDLLNKGYMEGNGYSWAQPRGAELEVKCYQVMEKLKNK